LLGIFSIPTKIKQGDVVELLIDYGKTYEPMRERKGYGKRNNCGNIKSDEDEKSCLQRNLKEHQDLKASFKSYYMDEIQLLIAFLSQNVLKLLSRLLYSEVRKMTWQQGIAMRRIY